MTYYDLTKRAFDSLTPGLKKVAETLLSNPVLFATHPARKVANIIDVSETMVIRFSKAIGFEGYSELQLCIRSSLLSVNPIEQESEEKEMNSFERTMTSDSQNISQAAQYIHWETAETIVNQLVEAKSIHIIGYYQSFSYAHWFTNLLNDLLGNASLYRAETDVGIKAAGKEHCVVIFSYYRYSLETIRLAEEAKENGNTIILITDSQLSPITEYGDHVLTIQIAKKSILEKGPVTFSVLNSLLLHIEKKIGQLEFVNPAEKYYIK